jgi:hypothetical protein
MPRADPRPAVADVSLDADRMAESCEFMRTPGMRSRRLTSLGLAPASIEARPAIDHELFTVREPAGHVITLFSSHASGQPA